MSGRKRNRKADSPPIVVIESAPTSVPLTKGQIWWEVIAVLSIGVLPQLSAAIVWAQVPLKLPYLLDSLDLIARSVFVSFATLYLIHRSNEPFVKFGLTRPQLTDIPLGILLLLGIELIWIVGTQLLPPKPVQPEGFDPVPSGAADFVLMIMKYAANGFAEELVTRAYLISRLEYLLESRAKAVMVSSLLFASYHLYYGLSGLTCMVMCGILFGVTYLLVRRIWPLAFGHMLWDIHAELAFPA